MPRLAASFAALAFGTFLMAAHSHGQVPTRTPDLTFNDYYESLVIPLSPAVLSELRLTELQKESLKKLGPIITPDAKATLQQRKSQKEALNNLFTEVQRNRFRELTFQYQGALASFNLPDVAKALGITAEQRQKLISVQYLLRSGSQNFSVFEKQFSPGNHGPGKFVVQLRLSCDCVAESVLLPPQMLKWREMQGKPFIPRPASWQ